MRVIVPGADETLFSGGSLREWLEDRHHRAIRAAGSLPAEEALLRPYEQVAQEAYERWEVTEPQLLVDEVKAAVDDEQVDVSGDFLRAISDPSRPCYVAGTRISFHVPYAGPGEALRLRGSTSSLSPPRAAVRDGEVVVSRAVPADTLERDRERVVAGIRSEVANIEKYLGYARSEIVGHNERLREDLMSAAERRRRKVLADRDTEAMLRVPLRRDGEVVKSYQVRPATRKRLSPYRRPAGHQPFVPEPAITEDDFGDIIADIARVTQSFERLAVTYVDMDEERLRDQILTVLAGAYDNATGESFSKRGKSDIYLPWEGGAVFLAECKWWSGPSNFENRDLPQLLDRYVVWRDTHAAMVVFIRNKDATKVIATAGDVIRSHPRYVRDGDPTADVPVFVLHKNGDPDREVRVALVTAVIRP